MGDDLMIQFLRENIATVIVLAVLALAVALAIGKMVKDRKNGIGPCGQRCEDCARECPHAKNEE